MKIGMCGEMKSKYYDEHLEIGLKYQDFAIEQLYNIGIVVNPYTSQENQRLIGEGKNGIEIKFDGRMETGNVYIETQEKSDVSRLSYYPSGIYRNDNTWLYVIGNYNLILIFGKKTLQILFESGRYPEIEISNMTSKGFLLPISFAKERVAVKFIEIE